jgi:hypothetical protein
MCSTEKKKKKKKKERKKERKLKRNQNKRKINKNPRTDGIQTQIELAQGWVGCERLSDFSGAAGANLVDAGGGACTQKEKKKKKKTSKQI